MPMTIACRCGERIVIRNEQAVRQVRCPACGQSLLVPRGSDREAGENGGRESRRVAKGSSPVVIGLLLGGAAVLAGGLIGLAVWLTRDKPAPLAERPPDIPAAADRAAPGPVLAPAEPAPPAPREAEPPPAATASPLQGRLSLSAVAFSPDGKLLATGHWMPGIDVYELKVWDFAAGKERFHLETRPREQGPEYRDLAFAPGGRWFASLDGRQVKVWDLNYGKLRHAYPMERRRAVGGGNVSFSHDGRLVVAAVDQVAAMMDIVSGEVRRYAPDGVVRQVVCSPIANIAVVNWDNQSLRRLEIVDLAAGGVRDRLDYPYVALDSCFSADGKSFAAAAVDGPVYVWDAVTWNRRAIIDRVKSGGFHFYSRIALSPDGRLLAGVPQISGQGQTELWDIAALKSRVLKAPFSRHLAFAPDGKALAVATIGPEAGLLFFDPETGQETSPWR